MNPSNPRRQLEAGRRRAGCSSDAYSACCLWHESLIKGSSRRWRQRFVVAIYLSRRCITAHRDGCRRKRRSAHRPPLPKDCCPTGLPPCLAARCPAAAVDRVIQLKASSRRRSPGCPAKASSPKSYDHLRGRQRTVGRRRDRWLSTRVRRTYGFLESVVIVVVWRMD